MSRCSDAVRPRSRVLTVRTCRARVTGSSSGRCPPGDERRRYWRRGARSAMEDFYDGVPSSKSSYPCPDLSGDRARHGHPRPARSPEGCGWPRPASSASVPCDRVGCVRLRASRRGDVCRWVEDRTCCSAARRARPQGRNLVGGRTPGGDPEEPSRPADARDLSRRLSPWTGATRRAGQPPRDGASRLVGHSGA